jgi:hypothetical protein
MISPYLHTPNTSSALEVVREYAAERLDRFETPKTVDFANELLKMATEKIQKYQIAGKHQKYYTIE